VYDRILDIALPRGQAAFLWGPRQIGKSTHLQTRFADSLWLDMLDSSLFLMLNRRPGIIRELIAAAPAHQLRKPIVIDEVQKVPLLLDEVHWLIVNRKLSFLLCGSSARKLKNGRANLLGGRAWRFEMFPLVTAEVPDFNLLRALTHGLMPNHYQSAQPERSLVSFVRDYLREEIAAEAHARNLAAFAKFLELVGIMNGELVNYAKIASDVGVDAKSVRSYFSILEDTLLGSFLEPLSPKRGSRKQLTATPKFYLFDPGIARTLRKTKIQAVAGPEAGHLFETFLLNEIRAYLSYRDLNLPLNFYRTRDGAEVDFVIDRGAIAIEAKISDRLRTADLRSISSFQGEYPRARVIVVALEPRKRVIELDGRYVEIYPWRMFCEELWAGKIA
jgi:predicted AAA+ superfamily ATPase